MARLMLRGIPNSAKLRSEGCDMNILENPYRKAASQIGVPEGTPFPSDDWATPTALLARCPKAAPTPLTKLSQVCDVAELWIKDERERMGLGSFKALGAAYVIASDPDAKSKTFVTASAGNHGLSVATGAQVFGAKAVIYLAETVPESFADRLRATGAEVRREGAVYEDSMLAAARAAQAHGWFLLSDSSWEGYIEPPLKLMEGYLSLMAEVFDQITRMPTHIFLQAGVGGLASACAAAARKHWGDRPTIIVVEPTVAPALMNSIQQGMSVHTDGPVSSMGRLDCKEPSVIALKGLARDADWFCTMTDAQVAACMPILERFSLATSPSGGAGLAALISAGGMFGLTTASRALCILSEGPA
jgi:diaminopropionate ammonia-lyase